MSISTPSAPTPSDAASDLLVVRDLTKHFPIRKGLLQRQVGAVQAVDDVTFSVRRGETLSLVGESGCGKTTTGRMITRLIEPTGGQVLLDGRDITHLSAGKLRPLRRDVQMIFQDPYGSLNPRHTVGTIVGTPYRLQKIATPNGVKRAVQDTLELVGLSPEHYNRYPHEFSGGQRQRIGIARALALKPKLIVADEPVSALDVSIQAQVINLLEDLQSELGLTYVMIAHDLSVVRPRHPLRTADAPVHDRAAVGGADPGHQAAHRPRPDPAHRGCPLADQPPARLPVLDAVLESPGGMPHRRSAADRPDPGAPGGLPLPGECRRGDDDGGVTGSGRVLATVVRICHRSRGDRSEQPWRVQTHDPSRGNLSSWVSSAARGPLRGSRRPAGPQSAPGACRRAGARAVP